MLCQYNKSFPGQRLYLLDVAAGAKPTDCGNLVAVDFSLFLPERDWRLSGNRTYKFDLGPSIGQS